MSIDLIIIVAIILPNLGGLVNSIIVIQNLPWYDSLKKPKWNPPNWIFGPVWTILYTAIGYASYLVYSDLGDGSRYASYLVYSDPGDGKVALLAYIVNLLLNWAWTPFFFGIHQLKLAFYEILLVDLTTLIVGYMFWQINQLAGYLFIPYALWLVIATTLNYRIYKDNPKAKKQRTILQQLFRIRKKS